jgi:hypothetical protein
MDEIAARESSSNNRFSRAYQERMRELLKQTKKGLTPEERSEALWMMEHLPAVIAFLADMRREDPRQARRLNHPHAIKKAAEKGLAKGGRRRDQQADVARAGAGVQATDRDTAEGGRDSVRADGHYGEQRPRCGGVGAARGDPGRGGKDSQVALNAVTDIPRQHEEEESD